MGRAPVLVNLFLSNDGEEVVTRRGGKLVWLKIIYFRGSDSRYSARKIDKIPTQVRRTWSIYNKMNVKCPPSGRLCGNAFFAI